LRHTPEHATDEECGFRLILSGKAAAQKEERELYVFDMTTSVDLMVLLPGSTFPPASCDT
jgi:hypothetical protein